MKAIILLLPLLLLVTPAIAHATNEGSYIFGYSAGYDDYHNCFIGDSTRIGDCSPPSNDEALGICVVGNQAVTNSTACLDGYIQGWQHWCKSDTKDCVEYMLEGRLPGALISGHNLYHTADGNYIRLGPKGAGPTIPDLSKGVCPPGKFLDKTIGIYTCRSIHRAQELHPNVKLLNNQWQRAW
jgi:hypothetical protein